MSDIDFIHLVRNSISIRQVLLGMELRPAGGNYQTVKRRIAALHLDTSHFLGQGHLKGKRIDWMRKTPLAEILVLDSLYKGGTYRLKNRLLKEGILRYKCSACGLLEWQGQPIPLELEHQNGDRNDNRLDNLSLLCPNCHALTPTYRAKNIKPRW